MYERVFDEIRNLKKIYKQIKFDENLTWLHIPDYPLPNRFNYSQTPLLIIIPSGYPQTPPDNFFVRVDLKNLDGSLPASFNPNPNSSSGPAPIPGDWGWFSWHAEDGKWHPSAIIEDGDNLSTYLRSINICLRGEE